MSKQQIIGVNLGGWLITEPWMSPDIYKDTGCVDEKTLSVSYMDRIITHRDTFITEDDIVWLSQHDVTHVRIPVGYWLFEDVDGYTATVDWLDTAFRWAEKYSIKILVDFHGAKDSQNGEMHSGMVGAAGWFDDDRNQQDTIDLLVRIAGRYNASESFWGIELLNEPKANGHYWKLLKFYRRAYAALRNVLRPGVIVMFHDGFHPWLFTGALLARRGHPVVMDVHWYHGMFNIKGVSPRWFLRILLLHRRASLYVLRLFQPVVVGEWSSVLPQSLFDATPTAQHESLLNAAVNVQRRAYRPAAGHFYWNYTAQGRGMWNYRAMIDDGVITTI